MDLTSTTALSDLEFEAIFTRAVAVGRLEEIHSDTYTISADTPRDEALKTEAAARNQLDERVKRRQEELNQLRAELDRQLVEAYRAGAEGAVERADRNAWNARSVTLYLVVLAVVAMPAIAMLTGLDPQTFGSYIAPVTGIAGTVVGYWFGALSRPTRTTQESSQ
jgi:hypothetical protein